MKGVVAVASGQLRGSEEGGIWVFRGVPYARAPIGRHRWRPPEPAESWSGLREVVSWGPIAPQSPPTPGLSVLGDPTLCDEDCLNLNVWTPGLDDGRRPVLVWVHGGGFTTGTGASAIYHGDRLCRSGDVVVVTLNYRLGALGFLAHPALGDEAGSGFGNWGLRDQLAALEWVSANISAFGGDPSNVTLFGESAGAMSICALIASGAGGHLFHRAAIQSGPPATSTVAWGARRARRLVQLALAGTDGTELERAVLETLEPGALVGATEQLAKEAPDEDGLPLPLLPVVDGALLTRAPADAVADGATETMPLLIGTNRDEATLFLAADRSVWGIDLDRVVRRLARVVPHDAAEHVVRAYLDARAKRGESVLAKDVLTSLTTDFVFRLPSLALATASLKHQPRTFVYMFDWESPFVGGVFGSSHGLEMPFVFGTVDNEAIAPFTGSGTEAMELSRAMQRAWLSFARNGDPSCEELGDWPAYDPLRRPTMRLGSQRGVVEDPRREERIAWEEGGVSVLAGHHHDHKGA